MPLTRKQTAFALAMVEGKEGKEAYREAGYSVDNMSDASIAVEVSRLKRNDGVRRIIEEGTGRAIAAASWSRAEAIDRLERVNAVCLKAIEGDSYDAKAVRGFMDTLRELNALTCVGSEVAEDKAARFGTRARDRDYDPDGYPMEW